MSVLTHTRPRPDLEAYREATTLPFPELVKRLSDLIGKKATAYIASVKDVRAVERWMSGASPYKNAENRLRLAFQIAKVLSQYEGQDVARAWLTGLNPELDDRVPIRLLREEEPEAIGPQILSAVRAFLAGG